MALAKVGDSNGTMVRTGRPSSKSKERRRRQVAHGGEWGKSWVQEQEERGGTLTASSSSSLAPGE
eukprot:6203221-Pleurochrysis_carterae.AAC.5